MPSSLKKQHLFAILASLLFLTLTVISHKPQTSIVSTIVSTVPSASWRTSQLAQVAPTTGLVAHWKFDEGSGTTAADSSGSGNGGTISTGTSTPLWTIGQIGGSLNLDGYNDHVVIPTSIVDSVSKQKNYSLSLWFYLNVGSRSVSLINIAGSSSDRNGIGIHSSGSLQGGNYNGSVWIGHTKYLSWGSDVNKWHHVVLVNNVNSSDLYFDGSPVITVGNYAYTIGSNIGALLGKSDASWNLNGRLDDVRVYNRSLSAQEASTLYNEGLSGVPVISDPTPPDTVDPGDVIIVPTTNHTVTVSKSGSGAGTVSGGTINCGIVGTSACTQLVQSGNSVTLTATPSNSSIFTGWSGGGCTGTGSCTITPTIDTAVTATFDSNVSSQFILTATPTGSLPSWAHYTTISVTTNTNATCKYSTSSTTSYASITNVAASPLGTIHKFPITALTSGASYVYYAYCRENSNYSPPYPIVFNITADKTIPEVVDLSATFVYFDTAIIQWNTTEPSDTVLEYGTSQSLGLMTDYDYSISIPHAVTLTGLQSGTTYYYRVINKDKSGNVVTSNIKSFTTLSKNYAKEFYVATNGLDTNPGTIDRPFATLEKATAAVKAWKITNSSCVSPVVVWLRGGSYYRDNYLYLSDQNTVNCPTIYSSYSNETAVITGGKTISGFSKVTDSSVLSKFSSVARNNIYQVDLPSNNITDYGDLRNVAYGTLAPLELIINDEPMTLARYPNNIENTIRTTSYTISGTDPVLGYGNDPKPSSWQNKNDIWVHGWFKYDWKDHHQRVKSFDLANFKITLDSSKITSTNGSTNANADQGYGPYNDCCAGFFYFENIIEELDMPGEYYLDRGTGILYFWPTSDISQAKVQVTVSKSNFVKSYSASNIIFQNLIFENNRSTAFYLTKTNGVTLINSTVRNIGASAFLVTGGDQNNNNGVYDSHIYNIGSYGVSLYSVKNSSLTGGRNFVLSNKIHNTGRWDVTNFGGAPIYVIDTNPYVSHNEIYDQLNLGIYFYDVNNGIIEYNNVHDVMKLANDNSGIYVGGGNLNSRGNIVKYNYVHDIFGVPWNKTPDGIYFDNATPGDTAFGNVIDTVAPARSSLRVGGAFMIGAGRDIIIENNVVYNSQVGIYLDVWSNVAQLLGTLSTVSQSFPYNVYYPEGTIVTTNSGLVPEGTIISRNIFFTSNPWSTIKESFKPYIDQRDNLINIDPHFIDASNHNFQLQNDSPAYALGFKQIPFEKIGLLKVITSLPPPIPVRINGSCSTTLNQCTTGTFSDLTDTTTNNLWSCLGSNGGTTAQCWSAKNVLDTTPPTISAISTSGITTTGASVTFTTNEGATTQIEYGLTTTYGNSTSLISTLVTSHTQSITSLSSNTTYHYRVISKDSSGNTTTSPDQTFTTLKPVVVLTPDTTLPIASITSPSTGIIKDTVNLVAVASDPISPSGQTTSGLLGVQFKLDGINLGQELTTAPFSGSWNTLGVSNGKHILTAVARDVAGNIKVSNSVTVTIENITTAVPPLITPPVSPVIPATNPPATNQPTNNPTTIVPNTSLLDSQIKPTTTKSYVGIFTPTVKQKPLVVTAKPNQDTSTPITETQPETTSNIDITVPTTPSWWDILKTLIIEVFYRISMGIQRTVEVVKGVF